MLTQLIAVIALFVFLLMLLSGAQMEEALYRSIVVYVVLFTGVYLATFLLNMIRETPDSSGELSSVAAGGAENHNGSSNPGRYTSGSRYSDPPASSEKEAAGREMSETGQSDSEL